MHFAILTALLLAGAAGAPETTAAAATTDAAVSAATDAPAPHVVYCSGGVVYLSVGHEDGLAPGDTVEVMRDGKPLARLRVLFAASHQASCSQLTAGGEPARGDLVRIGSHAHPAQPELPVPGTDMPRTAASAPPTRRLAGHDLGGRLGLRFLAMDDRSGGHDFTRPEVDARISGERIRGSGFGLDVRIDSRARFTANQPGSNGRELQTRVYRAAGIWQSPQGRWRLAAGRLNSPDLPQVSIFDGALGGYLLGAWSLGLFSGSQPDPRRLGYSTFIREHGAFAKIAKRGAAAEGWSLTGGAVASYHQGEVDREYLFLQWNGNTERWTTNLSQEIDFNRAWKRAAGEKAFSLTSTYGSCQLRPLESWALETGYDDRRNIRLYRDKETPETQFDDSHQRGYWGGLSKSFSRRYQFALRARLSDSAFTRRTHSVNLTSSGNWPRLGALRVRLRNTQYDNGRLRGWLHTISAGGSIGSRLSIDVTQGVRIERSDGAATDRIHWSEIDADLSLGRSWSLSLSAEINRGSNDDHRMYYSGLRWRF